MDKVGQPTRSDMYTVKADVEKYTPEGYVTITLKSYKPEYRPLGVMIYAVQAEGSAGAVPCRAPGCRGVTETRVGSWELTGETNYYLRSCPEVLTHTNAEIKKYTETYRWIAPTEGLGGVYFRVIVKRGSTNGGWFYWPMAAGDLYLDEDV